MREAIVNVIPTVSYENDKKFIITSEYISPKVRYVYGFSNPLTVSGINSEVRNTNLEKTYTETGTRINVANRAVIGTLFIFNMPLALTLIKLLQFFEFFNIFNLDYPGNVLMFFELFKGGIFSFLPNFFKNIASSNEKVNTCETPNRMGEEDMSCSFLNNCGDFLTLILIILAIKVVFIIFSFIFRGKKSKNLRSTKQNPRENDSKISKKFNSNNEFGINKVSRGRRRKVSINSNLRNSGEKKSFKKYERTSSLGNVESGLSISRFSKKPSFAGAFERRAFRSRTWAFIGEKLNFKKIKKGGRTLKVKIYEVVDKISQFLNIGHLVLLMRMALVDFMIPIAINVYFLHGTSFAVALNWAFSCLILALYGILYFYGWTVMRKTDIFIVKKFKNKHSNLPMEEQIIAKRFLTWMNSRSNFKEELKTPYKYLPEIIGFGETICCFALVIFHNYFLLQILPIMLLKGFLIILHFKKKDIYTERLEQLTNLINELLLFTISVLFVIYYFVSKHIDV